MKARTLISIEILVFVILIIAGGCATKRQAISKEDFFMTWSGTWINTDLKGAFWLEQKKIVNPDGSLKNYTFADDNSVQCERKTIVLEKWIEKEGGVWYICTWECLTHGRTGYEIGKISDSGNTWEFITSRNELTIEDWQPENIKYMYRIYYRQK